MWTRCVKRQIVNGLEDVRIGSKLLKTIYRPRSFLFFNRFLSILLVPRSETRLIIK